MCKHIFDLLLSPGPRSACASATDASTGRIQTVGLVSPDKSGQIALLNFKLRMRGEGFLFVSLIVG
jgi:hypothetical protein